MLSKDFGTLIAPQARVLNFIWGAFILASVFYAAVAWFLFGSGDATSGDAAASGGSLNQIGIGALVLLGFGAVLYQRKALGRETLAPKLAREPVWPPAGAREGAANPQGGGEIFAGLSAAEKRLACLWPHYQTTMIVVFAMLEAIAVVGLVLSILQGDFRVVIPFSAAALVMLVLKRPRPGDFFRNLL